MRAGVSASCVALPHGQWPLVLDFLAERLPGVSRAEWLQRMAAGEVLAEDGSPLPPQTPYRRGIRVYYYRTLPAEPPIPFEEDILYQDEHLLVADKPHFLPVTPGGRFVQQTLLTRLKRRTGIETLTPMHRIDRETAGLVLFAIRPQDRGTYQTLFRTRQVHKLYEAIAPLCSRLPLPAIYRSRIEPDVRFFRQREVPGTPNSETRITLLDHDGARALYQLEPLTGRTHQLRVHMAALGCPIEGDRFYPVVAHGPNEDGADYRHPLQLLARAIAFDDPVTGQRRAFTSRRQLQWK